MVCRFVSLVVVCYLDRTSLAFAALQLCEEDWFNAKVYGLVSSRHSPLVCSAAVIAESLQQLLYSPGDEPVAATNGDVGRCMCEHPAACSMQEGRHMHLHATWHSCSHLSTSINSSDLLWLQ